MMKAIFFTNAKYYLLLWFFIFGNIFVNAQASYTAGTCKGTFMDIRATGTLLPGSQGDDVVPTFAFPFPVIFYTNSYSSATIGSNGFIRFTPSTRSGGDFGNVALAPGFNLIAALWDDLNTTTGTGELDNGIYTQVMGAAPNRVLIIQWVSSYIGSSANSDQITFEVKIHETTNEIEIIHQDLIDGTDTQNNGISATVGVAGLSNTTVTQSYFNQTIIVPKFLSYKPFTNTLIPPPYTFATCAPSFVDIRTTGALVPGSLGDDVTVAIAIPFAFMFYNQCFTTGTAGSNGFLRFAPSSRTGGDFSNVTLASGMNLIAPLWDDLNTTSGTGELDNGIYTQINGAAPNRNFVIQWVGSYLGSSGNTDQIVFQVILFEGTNQIIITHNDLTDGTDTQNGGSSATVGIAGPLGSTFVQTSLNTTITPIPSCFNYTPGVCSPAQDITCPASVGPLQCGSLSPITTISGELDTFDLKFNRPTIGACVGDTFNTPYYEVKTLLTLKAGTYTFQQHLAWIFSQRYIKDHLILVCLVRI